MSVFYVGAEGWGDGTPNVLHFDSPTKIMLVFVLLTTRVYCNVYKEHLGIFNRRPVKYTPSDQPITIMKM